MIFTLYEAVKLQYNIKEKRTMKQINNGFDACYYLTEDAKLYNCITKNYIKPNENSYVIMTAEGKRKKISIKKLIYQ